MTALSILDTGTVIDTDEEQVYHIVEIIESASAFVCIAHAQKEAEQTVVLKVLREYKDERYQYGSSEERFKCQKEAFCKNFKITPGIYHGLAQILQPTLQEFEKKSSKGELQSVTLGSIAQNSDEIEHVRKQDSEYALVMSYLPEKQRLDLLLQEESSEKQKELLDLLVTRIEQMHKDFHSPTTAEDEDGNIWGSYQQLRKKLEHNLNHFDLIKQYEPELYKKYYNLKEDFQCFITKKQLQEAFEARQQCYVKQCHGDLKTKNIWIETIKPDDNFLHYVSILDAVDFNESYRNIDVLADLAMLAVDVEAIGNEELGTDVREKYLLLTKQEKDDGARIVLAYYLLEKAIVCAIMCLVYDHGYKQLGKRFLEIASNHANKLGEMIGSLTAIKDLSTVL